MIRFPIEEGQVLQFAQAIGDRNPVYSDREYATAASFASILAPPTFSVASGIFDPDFVGRPREGSPWPLAGRGGAEAGDMFHSEQEFRYFGHPVVGDVLTLAIRPSRTWERQGRRGGALQFNETTTEFHDLHGRTVIRSSFTTVQTQREVDASAPSRYEPRIAGDGVVLVRDLNRTQIVMYAAAAGDYHPLHHDEALCHQLGYPSIFPHGMFIMGLAGRLLTDRYGDGALQAYRARFLQPAWPGDTLTGRLAERDADGKEPAGAGRRVEVEVTNQHGAVTMLGDALIRA